MPKAEKRNAAAAWSRLSPVDEMLAGAALQGEHEADQATLAILASVLHLSWQMLLGATLALLCFAAARLLEDDR